MMNPSLDLRAGKYYVVTKCGGASRDLRVTVEISLLRGQVQGACVRFHLYRM